MTRTQGESRASPPVVRASLTWVAAGMVAGILAILIAVFLLHGRYSREALAAGWLTALLNALVARWINRRAMGVEARAFLLWGVAGNVLRVLALLGILVTVIFTHRAVRSSFFASVFAGIFVFMAVEVAELFRRGAGKRETT